MPNHYGRSGFLYTSTALLLLAAPITLALALGQPKVALAFAIWFGLLAALLIVWISAIGVVRRKGNRTCICPSHASNRGECPVHDHKGRVRKNTRTVEKLGN